MRNGRIIGVSVGADSNVPGLPKAHASLTAGEIVAAFARAHPRYARQAARLGQHFTHLRWTVPVRPNPQP
jgi:hypothetical protein